MKGSSSCLPKECAAVPTAGTSVPWPCIPFEEERAAVKVYLRNCAVNHVEVWIGASLLLRMVTMIPFTVLYLLPYFFLFLQIAMAIAMASNLLSLDRNILALLRCSATPSVPGPGLASWLPR